ncbi:hypothetical protein [Paeniglutamicibacter gangotriensis]|uniref:Uncharacterized protein n=1 Tax=Paeniglutamicibacter gangotriensis Lz1y TaxID=1276920 RepID=M7NKW2_9MICC|nr:hypothetical protein [Paeniglutamicibacter gangotriensis]EMQ99193.1 hypothetical protein ADIAG_01183 [Paeniglutamicibacter gangotriensis Lz1y]
MKSHAKELKTEAKRASAAQKAAADAADVSAKIAAVPECDRQMDKQRYSTFGLSPQAALDTDDGLWPTSFALQNATEKAWDQLAELIDRAATGPSDS